MEIQSYDQGSVLYVALSGGGWSRSEFPHEQVTLDFDSLGRLIGIEMLMAGTCPGTNPDTKAKAGLM